MLHISESEILARLRLDNPWWQTGRIPEPVAALKRRGFFEAFRRLVEQAEPVRAVVLMGPRRAGKTVMLWHLVAALVESGVAPTEILYASLDTPTYGRLPLERMLKLYLGEIGPAEGRRLFVMFDEIQYLGEWEVHLKSLTDTYPRIKFVASGSAAAALRLKGRESGAGRFTDFMLPPLTFAEYLSMTGNEAGLVAREAAWPIAYRASDIGVLNRQFTDYLHFGGFPELVASPPARGDIERFVRSDIIDKVLLRDLPGLYGVEDARELNNLFAVLALNSGIEISIEKLSASANIAKNTIRRYLEYLEAAFLVRRVERVDLNSRRFRRAGYFKVYLTNPSLRAALFGRLEEDDERFPKLAETAIFSHWMHDRNFDRSIRYARWSGGEVDMIGFRRDGQTPAWSLEIKWTDRFVTRPSDLRGLIAYREANEAMLGPLLCTTRTLSAQTAVRGHAIHFVPLSLYCYNVGKGMPLELAPAT